MDCFVTSRKISVVGSDHPAWDRYVQQHPQGSIFHTRAMIRVYAAAQGVEPYSYAAVDSSGAIVAMIVSYRIKTLRDFSSMSIMSSRAIQFAEPLCDPTPCGSIALAELIANHDHHMRSRSLLCEVRSICMPGMEKESLERNGYVHREYINYVIDLKDDIEDLWSRVHKRMRQKIRSTRRKGVIVRDDNSTEGVERLYALLRYSYGRARVPLLGQDLFQIALDQLPRGTVRLRTAFLDDEPIASIVSLIYGDRVFSWYGGTRRMKGLSPFACIVWDDIAWGADNGYSLYDFGGAGWPHEDYGPRRYKANFGGTEVRYGRYTHTYSPLRLRVASFAYEMSRRLGAWS